MTTLPSAAPGSVAASLRQSLGYFRSGFELIQRAPWLFLQVLIVFSIPALAASVLVHWLPAGNGWREPLLFLMDAATTVVAPVVFMMAVGSAYRNEHLSLAQVVRQGLPWLPRYIWTNAHTTAIFWVPVGILLFAHRAVERAADTGMYQEGLLNAGWGLAVGCAAVYFHTRTLLAPFLAVHSNLPASLATWFSWRLSHDYFRTAAATFIVCAAPVALPLGLLAAAVSRSGGTLLGGMDSLPHATGIGLQLIRLTLIPAVYALYHDLWDNASMADDAVPGPVAALMRA
ncbi:MAG: hypothetical protein AAB289_11560, partial [Chloroflexota bacterium]